MEKWRFMVASAIIFLLVINVAAACFGEIGGDLNYALPPNTVKTLNWGLINCEGNATFTYHIYSACLTNYNNFSSPKYCMVAGSNASIGQFPAITFSSIDGNILPEQTLYIGVIVNTSKMLVGENWSGQITAVVNPLQTANNGGATLQQGTVKLFHINLIASTTTTSTSTIPTTTIPVVIPPVKIPLTLVIGLLALIVIIIIIYFLLKRRKAKKAPAGGKGRRA